MKLLSALCAAFLALWGRCGRDLMADALAVGPCDDQI